MVASAAVITRTSPLLAALAAALLAACDRAATPAAAPPPHPSPLPADAAGSGSTPAKPAGDAGVSPRSPLPRDGERAGGEGQAPPPATAPAAPPVELLEAQALVPGASTALKAGEQVTVDPGATFRVTLKGTFPGARLSLLDGADAMVPGAGAREAGPATTVTFQPAAPLKPGSSYRLRIDGATTRELQAADGTTRGPVELAVLAAGEPPPEPRSRTQAKSTRAKKRP